MGMKRVESEFGAHGALKRVDETDPENIRAPLRDLGLVEDGETSEYAPPGRSERLRASDWRRLRRAARQFCCANQLADGGRGFAWFRLVVFREELNLSAKQAPAGVEFFQSREPCLVRRLANAASLPVSDANSPILTVSCARRQREADPRISRGGGAAEVRS